MSKFWFDLTKDILPNHMISVDTKDMPEFFQQEKFEGKTHDVPQACICCRSSASSADILQEAAGQATKKTVPSAESDLPEGLKESDKLPEPIYTPSTKAEIGDHDENISYRAEHRPSREILPGKGTRVCGDSS